MDDISSTIAELYFEEDVSQELDEGEPMVIPLNDFTFDVTSMFNETQVDVSEREPKIETNEDDFTFDLSSIFTKGTPEDPKRESNGVLEPCKENDIDVDSIEQNIVFEDAFAIDHSEEIEAGSDADFDCAQPKAQSRKYMKQLRTMNFKHQTKHAIAVLAHLCHVNCEPYIASAAVNEHFKWMSDRPIVRELDEAEVYKFYNSTKSSLRDKVDDKINSKRKRSCQKQKESSEIELSDDFNRVIQNEVILNAEDHDCLSSYQIKEITSEASLMIQKICRGFCVDRFSRRVKKKKIRGAKAKKMCNSLLVEKGIKKDFKGELLHSRPVWSHRSVKNGCYQQEYAINTQIDTLGKKHLKKWYYSRNKLIKDMR
jgi:hypothetical protein